MKTNKSLNLWESLIEFFNIWPLHQWVSSLVGLIFLYLAVGYLYNRWLSDSGGWLSWRWRLGLITSDLAINLVLGLYYMNHRDTWMGSIMVTCPIAISPVIFLLELFCVYLYYIYYIKK